jgi:hypothetical protein
MACALCRACRGDSRMDSVVYGVYFYHFSVRFRTSTAAVSPPATGFRPIHVSQKAEYAKPMPAVTPTSCSSRAVELADVGQTSATSLVCLNVSVKKTSVAASHRRQDRPPLTGSTPDTRRYSIRSWRCLRSMRGSHCYACRDFARPASRHGGFTGALCGVLHSARPISDRKSKSRWLLAVRCKRQ